MTLTQKELVMHKLKGDHDFKPPVYGFDKQGNHIQTQKCKVCGFEKKIIVGQYEGAWTAGTSSYSASPWGSNFAVTTSGVQMYGSNTTMGTANLKGGAGAGGNILITTSYWNGSST